MAQTNDEDHGAAVIDSESKPNDAGRSRASHSSLDLCLPGTVDQTHVTPWHYLDLPHGFEVSVRGQVYFVIGDAYVMADGQPCEELRAFVSGHGGLANDPINRAVAADSGLPTDPADSSG